jgi:fibronectin-binding autotransporter adhesin
VTLTNRFTTEGANSNNIPIQITVGTATGSGTLNYLSSDALWLNSGVANNGSGIPAFLAVSNGLALISNSLNIGNNGASTNESDYVTVGGGTLTIVGGLTVGGYSGTNVSTGVTNTFNLNGGLLSLSGAITSSTNVGQSNILKWTGGTLSAGSIVATNVSWSGGAISNNTLYNTNSGTLLVGNSTNGYAGKTIITGNYTASGSATTTFNIFGTNQPTTWVGGSSNYSTLAVSGTALYGGTMALNMTGYDLATNASTTLTLATNSFSGSSLTNVILKATTTNGISGSYATSGFTNFSFLNTNGYTAYLLKSSATNLTFSTAINNWVGGGNWGTGGSSVWSLGIDPNSTKAVAFFGTGSNTNVTLDQNRIVGGLIFTNASGYSISGNGSSTLTLDGSSFGGKAMVQNQLGNQTIAAPMVLNTTAEVTNSGAQTVTLSGAISGNGGLQIDSNGVTVLTGADTASGQNTVNAGAVLTVTNAGSLSSGALAVNGSLNLASSTSSTPGLLTGNGAINQSGAGTLTLASGNNTFSGTDALKSGGLVIGSGSSLTGATITQTGGTLSVSGTAGNVTASGGTLTGSGTLGALTVNAGATVAPGGANASTAANLTVSSLVLNGGSLT